MTAALLRLLALKHMLDSSLAKFSGKSEFFFICIQKPQNEGGKAIVQGHRMRKHQQASGHQSNAVDDQVINTSCLCLEKEPIF